MDDDVERGGSGPATDESEWDGNRAMGQADSAADYRSICAGERTEGEPDQRQHWALPHHYIGSEANAAGVKAARGRFSQTQGLANREAARRHLFEAHSLPSDNGRSVDELEAEAAAEVSSLELPREPLYRWWQPRPQIRQDEGDDVPTLFGHFAVFNQWTEIDSMFEGNFLERIEPGAFKKTFTERAKNIRVLFQHGKDPSIGSKVLGPISVLREDELGAYAEVKLFDTSYNRDLIPAIKAGEYGQSFRFRVMQEGIKEKPGRSDYNPQGLPERSIQEVQLYEFGPVTFPQYEGTDAGLRSLTDEFVFADFTPDKERLRQLIRFAKGLEPHEPEAADRSGDGTSDDSEAAEPSEAGTSDEVRRPKRNYLTTKAPAPRWKL